MLIKILTTKQVLKSEGAYFAMINSINQSTVVCMRCNPVYCLLFYILSCDL